MRHRCAAALWFMVAAVGCGAPASLPSPGVAWHPPAQSIAKAPPSEEPLVAAPAVKTPLTLHDALLLGFAQNPVVAQQLAAARAAAAGVTIANSAYYPTINTAAAVRREHQEFGFRSPVPGSSGTIGKVDRSIFSPSYEITATLLDFGQRSATTVAAQEQLFASGFLYNRALQQLAFEIEQAFFRLSAAQSQISASEESLVEARQVLRGAEVSFSVGAKPRQDVLQAESGLRRAEFDLEASRSTLEEARAAMARALGVPVSAAIAIAPLPAPRTAKSEILSTTVDALMKRAVEERPDLQAAFAMARANAARAEAAAKSRYPRLVASGSGNIAKDLERSDRLNSYTYGVGVQWELFTGFRRSGEEQQALAQAAQELAAAKSQAIAVAGEVWSAYFGFHAAQRRHAAAQALLSAATESYRALEEGYRNGSSSLLDLLAAQTSRANARTDTIRSRADEQIALARLALALGSGEQITEQIP